MPIKLNKRDDVKKTKVEELKKALEVGADGTPVNFHWKNDEAKEFIDFIKDESAGLLKKFRVISMSGPTKEIAKLIDAGKFLRPGGDYKRTGGTGKEGIKFGAESLTLTTKKVEWLVYLSDDELADNIEGQKLGAHIRKMVAKKIANEIVEAAIYGRALENPNGDNGILNVFNGVKYLIKKHGNFIDAKDLSTREITRKTLVNGKKVLKTKYRQEAQILMDSDLKIDLDELYNDPNGNRGNGEVTKTSIAGMSINEVPLMSSENAVAGTETTNTTVVSDQWQKVINCGDLTADVNIGDSIIVRLWKADELVYTVGSINTNTITVTANLLYDIPGNSTIHKAILDGADVIQGNPKNVVVGIQEDIKVEFERLAPDWYNVWYKMRKDIVIENPEAMVLIENLKSKD